LDDVVPNTSIEGGDGDFELKVQRSDGDDDHAAPTDDAPLLSLKWLWISIFAADVALQLVQWLGKTYVTSPRPSTRFRCSGWETGELQPEGEPRNGWPSGHVMNSVFVASVLTLLLQSEHFRRKNESCAWIAVTATWLLVAAICWARWALGCHTIVQIVGGACIGGMGGLLVMRASETRR
jgi:membrane-associated phospholipid phosphatase